MKHRPPLETPSTPCRCKQAASSGSPLLAGAPPPRGGFSRSLAAAGVRRDAPLRPRQVPSRSLLPSTPVRRRDALMLAARRGSPERPERHRLAEVPVAASRPRVLTPPALASHHRRAARALLARILFLPAPCRSSAPCSRLRDQQAPSWSGLLPSIPLSDTRTPPAARCGSCRSAAAPLRMLVGVAKASTASEVWAVWLCSASLSYMCGCSKVIPNQT